MRAHLLSCCALTAACMPPVDEEPLACLNPEPGTIEMGAGDLKTGWSAVADGDEIRIVFGPQGNHMIVVALAVTDMELPQSGLASLVTVSLERDQVVVGGTVGLLEPTDVDGDRLEWLGIRAAITDADVSHLIDETITVVGSVEDGCGRELTVATDLVFQD